jgi:hypothetical protein
MERLQGVVRESLMANSRVLSDVSTVLKQLKEFADTVEPLQEFSRTVVKSAIELDKTLLQAKDVRSVLKEAATAIDTLNRPSEPSEFLSQVSKGKNLLTYFQQHREIEEAPLLCAQLTQALSKVDDNCCVLLSRMIDSYNRQHGSGELTQAKVDSLKPVRMVISFCRKNQPSRYLQTYSGIRSQLLQANLAEGVKSGQLIKLLSSFLEGCALESQLESVLFRKFDSLNILTSTITPCYQVFELAVKAGTGERANIRAIVEFCAAYEESLLYLKSIAGESEIFVSAQALLAVIVKRIEVWLTNLNTSDTPGSVSEVPIDSVTRVIKELQALKDYARLLNQWGLHTAVHEALQKLISNLKLQARGAKTAAHGSLYQVNSLWFIMQRIRSLEALLPQEFQYWVGEELKTQIGEFFKHAWAPLEPSFSNTPNVVEFKKAGVLTRWSRNAVKKKFQTFNTTLTKTLAATQAFIVCDATLADQLRQMACQRLLPQFEQFVKTYTSVDFTKRPAKYTVNSNDSIRATLMQSFIIRPV